MSLIFRNLGEIPEETAHVLQNLMSANGLNLKLHKYPTIHTDYMLHHCTTLQYSHNILHGSYAEMTY